MQHPQSKSSPGSNLINLQTAVVSSLKLSISSWWEFRIGSTTRLHCRLSMCKYDQVFNTSITATYVQWFLTSGIDIYDCLLQQPADSYWTWDTHLNIIFDLISTAESRSHSIPEFKSKLDIDFTFECNCKCRCECMCKANHIWICKFRHNIKFRCGYHLRQKKYSTDARSTFVIQGHTPELKRCQHKMPDHQNWFLWQDYNVSS